MRSSTRHVPMVSRTLRTLPPVLTGKGDVTPMQQKNEQSRFPSFYSRTLRKNVLARDRVKA